MASSLRDVLVNGSELLSSVSDSPRLDAELLLCLALDVSRSYLHAHPEETPTPEQLRDFEQYLARRQSGEPIAHLRGKTEFWSLELRVTADTLIPRPETEHLVEEALKKIPADADWRIADLGTGSGAIALAIGSERPHCHILAIDLSVAALDVAEHNRQRLNIKNVEFRHSNWLSATADDEVFNIIISNPPYIAEADPHLQQGDVRFDPRFALTSGVDGLDAIRLIIDKAPPHLVRDGWLMIEHGYEQGPAVAELFKQARFVDVETLADLARQPRLTIGRLANKPS